MTFRVINNPNFKADTGFTQGQFKKLDGLYLQAAAHKVLTYRTVTCDFEEKVASYTYYKSEGQSPYLQFMIRQVGPRTMMYEVWKGPSGRIAKSGVFDRAFEKLQTEIEELFSA